MSNKEDVKIFATSVEQNAIDQIELLSKQEAFSGAKIRIMPDVHGGKGCVIGFTADLGDKVIPNIVGVDIGCGVLVSKLDATYKDLNMERLDQAVHQNVPAGSALNEEPKFNFIEDILAIRCVREIADKRWSAKKWNRQIGTLGGGNHFVEVNVDDEGSLYLVIHSGSRNLGSQVANFYQRRAIQQCSGLDDYYEKKPQLIEKLKREGRAQDIQPEIKKLRESYVMGTPPVPEELCFLQGSLRDDYLHDMRICQRFAVHNRRTMMESVLEALDLKAETVCDTVHNYIDDKNIVRKGAVSSAKGELFILPMNMRDGSLICEGKGNEDWNYSAPHGAGRLMSRTQALKDLDLETFKATMDGIYSTTVGEGTLDEAPGAYKPLEAITSCIGDTADIKKKLKPIYNFKAINIPRKN